MADPTSKAEPIEYRGDGCLMRICKRNESGMSFTATPADLAAAGYVPASQLAELGGAYEALQRDRLLEKQAAERARDISARLESQLAEATAKLEELTAQNTISADALDFAADRHNRELTELAEKLEAAESELEDLRDGWDGLLGLRRKLEAAEREAVAVRGMLDRQTSAARKVVEQLEAAERELVRRRELLSRVYMWQGSGLPSGLWADIATELNGDQRQPVASGAEEPDATAVVEPAACCFASGTVFCECLPRHLYHEAESRLVVQVDRLSDAVTRAAEALADQDPMLRQLTYGELIATLREVRTGFGGPAGELASELAKHLEHRATGGGK